MAKLCANSIHLYLNSGTDCLYTILSSYTHYNILYTEPIHSSNAIQIVNVSKEIKIGSFLVQNMSNVCQ